MHPLRPERHPTDRRAGDQPEYALKRVTTARLPTLFGQFDIHGYRSGIDGEEHVALVCGDLTGDEAPLVRIHSECLTGEVFGSMRCDCRIQLEIALKRIADEGRGVLVYLRGHEGRGIGLVNKLRAYALQDLGRDTVCANSDLGLPIDAREYGIAVQILRDLGVCSVRLMTNNPDKIHALKMAGVVVTERVSATSTPTANNRTYLLTKEAKLGHLFGARPRGPAI
jgi:3,4-dihydroxy 2-butanone 4-phosphate synthase/GTP cyclohydrolase II